METSIKVEYQFTANPYQASQWLKDLPDLVALDFEAASKFTPAETANFQRVADLKCTAPSVARVCRQRANADGLSHPSLTQLTHMSLAVSDSKAYVFLFEQPMMLKLLMNWIVTTDVKQIWHNLSFDGKHIFHHSNGKFPKNYEDSQLLAKTVLNHVETYKAKVGLKELVGHAYGNWAISADNFDVAVAREPHVLLYSATDACATYYLWNSIQNHIKETNG